jgi:signal transduction histidine kinase
MVTSLRIKERIRTAVITGLMLVSLLMVGLLSHQTWIAVTSQRQLVDDVLRDYSYLAADEFVRRSMMISGYGFYPVLGQLAQMPVDKPLPDLKAFASISIKKADRDEQENLSRAVKLARGIFRFAPGGASLDTAGERLPAPVVQALIAELRSNNSDYLDNSQSQGRVRTFHRWQEEEHYNFIYAIVDFNEGRDRSIIGVFIDNNVALEWLQYFINSRPLLPGSLTEGKLRNEDVFVKVLSGNEQVFQQGDYKPGSLLVTRTFDDNPTTIFGDMKVTLGLDPEVAGSLIIGGLPESRFPLVYGSTAAVFGSLWALAVLLMILALIMLYRDRSMSHLRSDFVSRVSHELRTPLAQIMMFAQTLLLDRVRSDDERRRSLEVIDKEAQRLSHLVDNILQFSMVERGRPEINMMRQPLYPLVREIADQFRPMMRDGRLVIRSDVGDDVEVELDVDAFRQMFVNLLDNAVKFSPAGENVDITLSQSKRRINVAVEDRGPGVPKADKQRIWEPYYRTAGAAEKAIGGTGIGLSVVNELAKLQAAYVSMTERQGGGSRFVIEFDIAGAAA